jgi:hypothetical protein
MRAPSDGTLAEGLTAYASKQANLQKTLTSGFQLLWKTPLEEIVEENPADECNDDDEPDGNDDSGDDGYGNGLGPAEDSDDDEW